MCLSRTPGAQQDFECHQCSRCLFASWHHVNISPCRLNTELMLCSFTLNLFYFYPNTPRAAAGGGRLSSVWLWLLLCQSPHTKWLCYQLSEWDAVWPAGSAIVLLRRLSFIVSWISSLSSAGRGRQQLPCAAHLWGLIVFVLFWTISTSRQFLWTTGTDI